MEKEYSNISILLFDGECNLCNRTVQFVLRRDPKQKIKFSSLLSEKGKQIMKHFGIPAGYMDSLVFVESGKVYYKSDAVLRMTRKLNGLWPVCSIFIVIPRFIRDYFYDRIAVNRIKWFGRTDTCWVMKEEYKDRFLN